MKGSITPWMAKIIYSKGTKNVGTLTDSEKRATGRLLKALCERRLKYIKTLTFQGQRPQEFPQNTSLLIKFLLESLEQLLLRTNKPFKGTPFNLVSESEPYWDILLEDILGISKYLDDSKELVVKSKIKGIKSMLEIFFNDDYESRKYSDAFNASDFDTQLSELDIKQKVKLGQGRDHHVFPSKVQPGAVIKTKYGDAELRKKGHYKKFDVEGIDHNQIKLFREYPQFCVKVYKETPNYAVLERLDADGYLQQARETRKLVYQIFHKYPEMFNNVYLGPSLTPAIKYLVQFEPQMIKPLYKLGDNFLKQLIIFLVKIKGTKLMIELDDLHDRNLAFDANKNIKIIDI